MTERTPTLRYERVGDVEVLEVFGEPANLDAALAVRLAQVQGERWAAERRAEAAEAERDRLAAQLDCLASWIMQYCPGEPSRSEGAVKAAIRLLAAAAEVPA